MTNAYFAEARRRALLSTIEINQKELWRYVRAEKSGKSGELIPVFTKDALGPLSEIQAAEEQLKLLDSDRDELAQILGDCSSVGELAQALHREKMKVSRCEHDVRVITERELASHRGISLDECLKLPSIIESKSKLERVKVEAEPIIADLEARLKAANKIVEKYPNL